MRILILDNYDSFTYNLFHLVEKKSDAEICVIKNDRIQLDRTDFYDKIILSPGPGLPQHAGRMPQLIKKVAGKKPILGVCLGMQAIGLYYGAELTNLKRVAHGAQSKIVVNPKSILFKHCPETFMVGRYHSWVINPEKLPDSVLITASDEEGFVMAIEDKKNKLYGVQFHPESILSEYGENLITNWLNQ